jgi:hypothetical protein
VRRLRPGRVIRRFKRSIIALSLLLLNISIIKAFPVSTCKPLKRISSILVVPWNDVRLFEQTREREDNNDAFNPVNEDIDHREPEIIPMKSAIKSQSMDLTDRFKYKVFSNVQGGDLPCVNSVPYQASSSFILYKRSTHSWVLT